jgi:F-type H+-transporting ATPase subunit b
MDEVLRSLGGLLLAAIPTFLLVVALHFYLKRVLFGPLARVLQQRYEATEGARRAAQDMLAQVSAKQAEYESALRNARSDIYREQEQYREKLRQDQAAAVRQARESAAAMVQQATNGLRDELAVAKRSLEREVDSLANQIVAVILRRRTA